MQPYPDTVLEASNIPFSMRVFEPWEAERVRKRGGIPVRSSEAAADAFMSGHPHGTG